MRQKKTKALPKTPRIWVYSVFALGFEMKSLWWSQPSNEWLWPPQLEFFESDPIDKLTSQKREPYFKKLIFIGEFTSHSTPHPKKFHWRWVTLHMGLQAFQVPARFFPVSQVLPTSVSTPEPPVPSPVQRSDRQRQTQMNARTTDDEHWDLGVGEMYGKAQGLCFSNCCLRVVWMLRIVLVGGSHVFWRFLLSI